MADPIKIDPNWPEWRKEEARAVNARRAQMDAAAKAQAAKPPQSGGPQGPSDLQLRKIRRENEARQRAEAEAERQRQRASEGSESVGGRARDRSETTDALIDEMVSGKRDNQSTDSSQ